MILLGIALFLAIFIGTILSFVNLSSVSSLKTELTKLNTTVKLQSLQINKLLDVIDSLKSQSINGELNDELKSISINSDELDNTLSLINDEKVTHSNAALAEKQTESASKPKPSLNQQVKQTKPKKVKEPFSLEKLLMGNGLLWMGAVILALGGVFLAKYSIEAGVFPPELRIIIGACFGVCLVGVAEYLYRNPKRFQINSTMISAALASGGLITCFSMALVAFDFYAFLSPLAAFAILAVISTAATWLSVRFGPILAVVGVVGAYVVPALVSTGSNNVFALLVYVAFVSISTLWVHAIVRHSWLWWLSVAGHFAWLFMSLFIGESNYDWVIFSFCLVSIYLFVLAPVVGWKLNQASFSPMPIKSLLMPRKEQLGIALPVIAMCLLYIWRPFEADILTMLFTLSALLLIAPYRHSAFDTWPFIALSLCILTFLKMPNTYDYTDNLFPFTGGYLFAQVSTVGFIIYSMFSLSLFKERPSYLLLLVLAPMTLMGLSYALSESAASFYLYSVWSVELVIIAAVFAFLGARTKNLLHKMTFLMLANGALTLIFTMLLSASTLTVAIVSQISLMAYLSHKYSLVFPSWLYKIAIAAVLLRLSAAPWLPAYMNETILGLHWSLIIYPIAFGLLFFARLFQTDPILKAWFTGSMLHLIALFVTTETSYLLVGSYPNLLNLSYQQSILLSMNWLILSAVYLWRRQTTSLKKMYLAFSLLLMVGSAVTQLYLSVLQNPFISYQSTGNGILVNWLFPLWAVPAIVLIAMLYARLTKDSMRPLLYGLASVFTVLYINGMIRSYYQPILSFANNGVGQQELYVYSIAWLVIAIGLIVFARKYNNTMVNKAGFGVLALVILKAFLVDLSNLEGLYRALSFIGLGLSLVGLGWLFQRFANNAKNMHSSNTEPEH